MNWDYIFVARSYEVQQKKVRRFLPDEWETLPFDDGDESFRVTINTVNSSAVITGLTNGREYFHQVRAVNSGGESDWTDEIETSLPAQIPNIPTGLEAQHGFTLRTMKLDWDDANLAERCTASTILAGCVNRFCRFDSFSDC